MAADTSGGETAADESGASDGTASLGTSDGEGSSGSSGAAESGTTADAVCGDGMITGDETCEAEDFAGVSCKTLGFANGALTCGDDCQYSSANCSTCGDGLTSGEETCDGPLGPAFDCASAGFTTGAVTCDVATCTLDTSGCSLCGDAVIEGPESCDSDNFGAQTCAGFGFDGGSLECSAGCQLTFASCEGGGYTEDFEGGVLPANFATSGSANWIVANTGAIEGSFSAHSGTIGHGQATVLTFEVNFFMAGTVEFRHAESTEDGFDFLRFYIDGVMQEEWSGILAAQDESYAVAAGAHTFEWRYEKDFSIDEGTDTVWVDLIVLVGGIPTP